MKNDVRFVLQLLISCAVLWIAPDLVPCLAEDRAPPSAKDKGTSLAEEKRTRLAEKQIPFRLTTVSSDAGLTNAFHDDPHWCGADGACSVPLNATTTVWLFGDTFIKKSDSTKNNANSFAFINNTAAVRDLHTGSMKFAWKDVQGTPEALMVPHSSTKPWYWPGDGFQIDSKLFIVNKVIVPKKNSEDNMFNFEWQSDDLLQVSNSQEAPQNWKWHTALLPEKHKTALIGTACLLKDEYAYFYTSIPHFVKGLDAHPTGVARISRAALSVMDMSKFNFWNGKKWVDEIEQSAVIFSDGAPEMTVTKMKQEPYLVATYMAPLSSDIRMRFSKKPEGPWSDPLKIFHCPEAQVEVLGKKNSVYSAKAHAELSHGKDEIVVSYCSNPGEMKHYISRPDLYYPRVIRVNLQPTVTQR
jgi:hypothetical protein